jgi:hypothetical protein
MVTGLCILAASAVASAAPGSRSAKSDHAYVGQQGATLELGNRVELKIPGGLPIGDSRKLTLSVARNRPRGRHVARGFLPVGPAFRFDGLIDATKAPLELTFRASNLPRKAGYRYALAVERRDLCTDENRTRRTRNGLCTTWLLHRAQRGPKGTRAKIPKPGGLRLQFGLVRVETLARAD